MSNITETKKSYKDSLNLPQTPFAMEAKLTVNEPPRLKRWQESKLYERILARRQDAEKWVLHDGPPFANGDIHIGHLINKTLKDVILRFRTMQGFRTPYVPGWDCHGLPIEHKIQEDVKKEGKNIRELSIPEVRKRCFDYAAKYAGIQSEQFQRLGILGEWGRPYMTMAAEYEAGTLEVFAKFVEAGLVYRKLRPVPWSVANQTALADAELEYQDVADKSVYVEFPMAGGDGEYLLVWTTTPWTLPANLAVAVHPDVNYARVRYERNGQSRVGVVAGDLAQKVLANGVVIETVKGADLVGREYRHPFIERTGRIVHAEYVTTTDGTGLVHTAPGHGEDDYETGLREKLAVYSPVLANGRFDESVPAWLVGKTVWEGNTLITKHLAEAGLLLAEETITHSYPHDWRSKTPIIFRATEQWFVAMDKPFGDGKTLRQRAIDAVEKDVEFVPGWGKARMMGMLHSRPDWCVSRQRAWGLPIPVFYNDKGESLLTPDSVRAVGRRFAEKGSEAWFTDEPAELLGSDFRYPPGFTRDNLRKEKDIFDVWFESGSSWNSVLKAREYLKFPSDLYLEGSDQHRGWFQLSLLPSLGATGRPPFRQVLTHGFAVKPDGTKVSKSDKEYVTVTQEIQRHGADLLRLWCCSVDYQSDIPSSPKAIQEFGDKYRKIRNTVRYLLSNLYDFSAKEAVAVPAASLDGWAAHELDQLIGDVTAAYDGYQIHRAFRLLHDFCAVQISAVYGNAMKDRLYCEPAGSPLRRRCQTVMYHAAVVLTKLLAPMLVYTADEAWEFISPKPVGEEDCDSVHLALLPKVGGYAVSEDWKVLMELRDAALGQLDRLKKETGLNKAGEAEIVYHLPDAVLRARLEQFGADLEDVAGCGWHSFAEGPRELGVTIVDRRQSYGACARCWKRRPDVGSRAETPDLCVRCADAVRGPR